jgi:hypothetical protein
MKIWNTKYCLTDGITEHEVNKCTSRGMVEISKDSQAFATYLHGEGKEWHRTEKEAIERANEVKIKKLKSLDKQVKKISAIFFD